MKRFFPRVKDNSQRVRIAYLFTNFVSFFAEVRGCKALAVREMTTRTALGGQAWENYVAYSGILEKMAGFQFSYYEPKVSFEEVCIQLRRKLATEILNWKGRRQFWVMIR